jgi:Domain of unknown function (DUF1707)
VEALLVSDREREHTVGLLRGHWMSGRLTGEEFESRVAEAWSARYAGDLWRALRWLPVDSLPAAPRIEPSGTAVAGLVFALIGLCVLLGSFGLLFLISLPISATGWILGRSARRSGTSAPRVARSAEMIGLVGTVIALLITASCAAIAATVF